VARSARTTFLQGFKQGVKTVLLCGIGLLVGILVLQVSLNLTVLSRQGEVGFGLLIRLFPVRAWISGGSEDAEYIQAYNRAAALANEGQFREAQTWFQRAAQAKPDDPEPVKRMCTLWLLLKDLGEAEKTCQRAYEMDPDDPMRSFWVGAVHSERGDHKAAEEMFRKTVTRRPDDPRVLNALATMLTKQGNHEEAEPYLRKAISSSPRNGLYQKNLAEVLARAGKCKEARQHARQAADLSEDIQALEEVMRAHCQSSR
jgi:tetratricopeptide (TPR) repeat protein